MYCLNGWGTNFFSNNFKILLLFMTTCALTRLPVPPAAKNPQCMMLPPPWLTVMMVLAGSLVVLNFCQIYFFGVQTKSSVLVLSDNKTCIQKLGNSFKCRLATRNMPMCDFTWIYLRYSFLLVTQQYMSDLQRVLEILNFSTLVPASAANCFMSLRVTSDFIRPPSPVFFDSLSLMLCHNSNLAREVTWQVFFHCIMMDSTAETGIPNILAVIFATFPCLWSIVTVFLIFSDHSHIFSFSC